MGLLKPDVGALAGTRVRTAEAPNPAAAAVGFTERRRSRLRRRGRVAVVPAFSPSIHPPFYDQ
jgi:hypothetical protein